MFLFLRMKFNNVVDRSKYAKLAEYSQLFSCWYFLVISLHLRQLQRGEFQCNLISSQRLLINFFNFNFSSHYINSKKKTNYLLRCIAQLVSFFRQLQHEYHWSQSRHNYWFRSLRGLIYSSKYLEIEDILKMKKHSPLQLTQCYLCEGLGFLTNQPEAHSILLRSKTVIMTKFRNVETNLTAQCTKCFLQEL